MKLAHIVEESLHIFWTTCGISMKFSGMMWLMIIVKVTQKKPGIHHRFSRYIFKKTTGGVKLNCPPAFLGL